MNVDELVRDALDEQAGDVRGPNEADLFARFAQRDRVLRARRIAVACSGLAIAVIIALVASSAAPQNRVDVSHRSPRQRRSLPSRTHRQTRTTTPVTSRLIAPPATANHSSVTTGPSSPITAAPPHIVIPPHGATPAKTHDTTPATEPSPPATDPVTTSPPTVPPGFTLDAHDEYGRMFMIQGTAPPGATITTSSNYADLSNGPQTFTAFYNKAWGGGYWVRSDTPLNVPFDVTFTCTCGGSITINIMRVS